MKNYGLQVKEIPIVFRGAVGSAILPPADASLTATSFALYNGYKETNNRATQKPSSFYLNEDKIYVKYNGVYYGELPKMTSSANGRRYGAKFVTGSGIDFSDYPFSIYTSSSASIEPQKFSVAVPLDVDNVECEIWVTPPIRIPGKQIFSADLTGNGQINRFYARFACGENGTLHLKPYVILNGNIRIDLCNFAQGGDQYIAGDNEEIEFDCYVPIETHAVAYVEAENVGEYPSLVDAAMTVQYEDFIESESIVGYEGVNLRRGRR